MRELSIWKLIYDLEYWIYIGTGYDVVQCKDNRPEYKLLVERLVNQKVELDQVPGKVLIELKKQANIAFYKRPMFWYLVKLWIWRF